MDASLLWSDFAVSLTALQARWGESGTRARSVLVARVRDRVVGAASVSLPMQGRMAVLVVGLVSDLFGQATGEGRWTERTGFDEGVVGELMGLVGDACWGQGGVEERSGFEEVVTGKGKATAEEYAYVEGSMARADVKRFEALQRVFEEAGRGVELAIAFIVWVARECAEGERSLEIRRASLHVIGGVARVFHGKVVARFLPGVASVCGRVLVKCRMENAAVPVAALDAMCAFICRAFPRRGQGTLRPTGASFGQVLAALRDSQRNEDGKCAADEYDDEEDDNGADTRSVRVQRSELWVHAAAEKVSTLVQVVLESKDGPRRHGNARVRLALAAFCGCLLVCDKVLDVGVEVHQQLVVTLVELCGDPFDSVRDGAMRRLRCALDAARFTRSQLESGLEQLILFVNGDGEAHDDERAPTDGCDLNSDERELGGGPGGTNGSGSSFGQFTTASSFLARLLDGDEEEKWVRIFEGYMHVMLGLAEKSAPPRQAEKSGESSRSLLHIITRLGAPALCNVLVHMHEIVSAAGTVEDPSEYIVLENNAAAIAFAMGSTGLLSFLHGPLLSLTGADENRSLEESAHASLSHGKGNRDFLWRGHVLLVLQTVIRGAIHSLQRDKSKSDGDTRQVLQCSREFFRNASDFALPAVADIVSDGALWADNTSLNSKQRVLIAVAQLFDELAALPTGGRARRTGADLSLTVLVSLLRDVSCGEGRVRTAAIHALRRVAAAARCNDERRLVARHLNFVVARLVRHLEQSWTGPVLQYVIGNENDDVCEQATALVEATLQRQCDELAGAGDRRAIATLDAVCGVLTAALSQKDSPPPVDPSERILCASDETAASDETVASVAMASMRKCLMYYCTDDDHDTGINHGHVNENPTENENEEKHVLNSFETVASSSLSGACDVLIGRSPAVRAQALSCAACAVRLLRDDQTTLLPHVASLLPLLPRQLEAIDRSQVIKKRPRLASAIRKRQRGYVDDEVGELVEMLNAVGAELPVVSSACTLLAALVECGGDFVRARFVKLIYPKLEPMIRLAACFPSLSSRKGGGSTAVVEVGALPSHGAMAASDAALKAVASIANVLPSALRSFSPSLIAAMVPYLGLPSDAAGRKASQQSQEYQRFLRRVKCAKTIVKGLAGEDEDAVWVALVRADSSAQDTVSPPSSALHAINVR